MGGEASVKCLLETFDHRLSALSRRPGIKSTFDRERVHHRVAEPLDGNGSRWNVLSIVERNVEQEAASRSRRGKRPPTASERLEELLGYPWPFPGRPPKHDLSTWTVTDD